jgi:uncharacterized protein with PIN domain
MGATVALIIANTLINLNHHMKVTTKRNFQNVLQEIEIKCLLIHSHNRKNTKCAYHAINKVSCHFNVT